MIRNTYNLLNQDVRGDEYINLLSYALTYCDTFLLVTSDPIDETSDIASKFKKLAPLHISSNRRSEWPGTQLLGGEALVAEFRLNKDAVIALTEMSESLFSWLEPEFPEDLCLIRPDGSPWLVTISHEQDAYFILSDDEKEILVTTFPSLSLQAQSQS